MSAAVLVAALAVKVTVAPQPEISGNCHPARVHFSGSIASDTAGPVRYTWVRSDKPSNNTFTLDFDKPGARPVTYDWLLQGPADGWVVLQVVSPQAVHSQKVRFVVTCNR
jgi:hypothetical protein